MKFNKYPGTRNTENLLLVIPDSQLQVSRHNTLFLVVACSIASQLKDLGGKVFEDSSEVNFEPNESFVQKTSRAKTHRVHRSLCAERSSLSSIDGEHDRQGTEGQLWPNATGTWRWIHRKPCHQILPCHLFQTLCFREDLGVVGLRSG